MILKFFDVDTSNPIIRKARIVSGYYKGVLVILFALLIIHFATR
jgi:hypothetical protein